VDIQITLSVVLDQVIAQLGVHAADILQLGPQSQMLNYVAGPVLSSPTASARTSTWEQARQAAPSWSAVCIIRIDNLKEARAQLADPALLSNEHFVCYCSVPLIAKGQVNEVLEVWHREPLAATPDWQGFLEALVGQTAIAIDNAALFEQLQTSHAGLV